MVDLEQLDERIKIREAIQEGRIQDAISLVNSIQPELLDNDRYLYFRLQVMLSYIKQGYGSKEEYDGVFSMCYFEVMICISLLSQNSKYLYMVYSILVQTDICIWILFEMLNKSLFDGQP